MKASEFKPYLAKLNTIAQANATHENFVEIQKIRDDILNAYNDGELSNLEKRALYDLSLIIMGEMRKELGLG